MTYIGILLWDENWGFGLVTKKIEFDRYQVWWYNKEEWFGEVDRKFIKKYLANIRLDSSDGRAVPL